MRRLVGLALMLAVVATGCDDRTPEEPGAPGTLPPVAVNVVGPQPGPDRDLPEVTNPFAADPNGIMEGRRLFVWYNCSGCHGGRAGGGMGPSLRDATWIYGNSHREVFNSIAEGRAYGMPAWGTKLPVEQIWMLTAYIKSLDTESEPNKPPPNPVYPDPPPRRDVEDVTAGGS